MVLRNVLLLLLLQFCSILPFVHSQETPPNFSNTAALDSYSDIFEYDGVEYKMGLSHGTQYTSDGKMVVPMRGIDENQSSVHCAVLFEDIKSRPLVPAKIFYPSGEKDFISAIALSPAEDEIYLGQQTYGPASRPVNPVVRLDMETGEQIQSYAPPSEYASVIDIDVSPDNQWLLVGWDHGAMSSTYLGIAIVYNVYTGDVVSVFDCKTKRMTSVDCVHAFEFSPANFFGQWKEPRLIVPGPDGEIILHHLNLNDGFSIESSFTLDNGFTKTATFSPDGETILSGSYEDQSITLWYASRKDINQFGQELRNFYFDWPITDVAFAPFFNIDLKTYDTRDQYAYFGRRGFPYRAHLGLINLTRNEIIISENGLMDVYLPMVITTHLNEVVIASPDWTGLDIGSSPVSGTIMQYTVDNLERSNGRVQILSMSGNVEVRLADAEEDDWIPAIEGMWLRNGDYLSTGVDSKAVLDFGKISRVVVKEMTQMRIAQLFSNDDISSTELFLRIGSVNVKVDKTPAKETTFKVTTPTAVFGVRGTQFSVNVKPDLSTELKVLEGIVEVEETTKVTNNVIVEVTEGEALSSSESVFVEKTLTADEIAELETEFSEIPPFEGEETPTPDDTPTPQDTPTPIPTPNDGIIFGEQFAGNEINKENWIVVDAGEWSVVDGDLVFTTFSDDGFFTYKNIITGDWVVTARIYDFIAEDSSYGNLNFEMTSGDTFVRCGLISGIENGNRVWKVSTRTDSAQTFSIDSAINDLILTMIKQGDQYTFYANGEILRTETMETPESAQWYLSITHHGGGMGTIQYKLDYVDIWDAESFPTRTPTPVLTPTPTPTLQAIPTPTLPPTGEVIELSEEVFDGNGGPLVAGTYHITKQGLVVPEGETLTIEAGAILKFERCGFDVYGQLNVNGTENARVIFTSEDDDSVGLSIEGSDGDPNPNDWYSLYFAEGSSGSVNHALLIYGGYGNEQIWLQAPVTLSHCEIGDCNHRGIMLEADATIENCYIRRCESDGIRIPDELTIHATIQNCRFENNGDDAIDCGHPNNLVTCNFTSLQATGNDVNAIRARDSITMSGDIFNAGIPYFVPNSSLEIRNEETSNVVVNVHPGVILKMQNNPITVFDDCELHFMGSEEKPIVITAQEDDEWGGDTRSDGNELTPDPGDWSCVRYLEGSRGSLNHTILRYGGGYYLIPVDMLILRGEEISLWYVTAEFADHDGIALYDGNYTVKNVVVRNNNSGIWLSGNGTTTIRNTTITTNNRDGINVEDNHSLTAENLFIAGNHGDGVEIESSADVQISNSSIFNNSNFAVKMDVLQVSDFKHNFWGDARGPFDENEKVQSENDELNLFNLLTYGNPVTDFVDWSQPLAKNPFESEIVEPTPTPEPQPSPTPNVPALLEPVMVYEFDKASLNESGWLEQPGGFDGAVPGNLMENQSFDSTLFEQSADFLGLEITVQPDQVTFLFSQEPVDTQGKTALIRAWVRSDNSNAQVIVGALRGSLLSGEFVDGSIGYTLLRSSQVFVEGENFFSATLQPDQGNLVNPFIQVSGVSGTETHIWLDRVEIYLLEAGIDSPN